MPTILVGSGEASSGCPGPGGEKLSGSLCGLGAIGEGVSGNSQLRIKSPVWASFCFRDCFCCWVPFLGSRRQRQGGREGKLPVPQRQRRATRGRQPRSCFRHCDSPVRLSCWTS